MQLIKISFSQIKKRDKDNCKISSFDFQQQILITILRVSPKIMYCKAQEYAFNLQPASSNCYCKLKPFACEPKLE